jgi:dihydrofolate reductase
MPRKIILYIAASLDGKIANQDGSIEWLEQFGFTEELTKNYHDFISQIDTTIMGYQSFKKISSFDPFPYPHLKNWVVSRQNRQYQHPDLFPLQITAPFQLEKEIIALKQEPSPNQKHIFLIGGGELTTALLALGLIDEIILSTIPIYLSDPGIPLLKPQQNYLLPAPISTIDFPVSLNGQKYIIRQDRFLLKH